MIKAKEVRMVKEVILCIALLLYRIQNLNTSGLSSPKLIKTNLLCRNCLFHLPDTSARRNANIIVLGMGPGWGVCESWETNEMIETCKISNTG